MIQYCLLSVLFSSFKGILSLVYWPRCNIYNLISFIKFKGTFVRVDGTSLVYNESSQLHEMLTKEIKLDERPFVIRVTCNMFSAKIIIQKSLEVNCLLYTHIIQMHKQPTPEQLSIGDTNISSLRESILRPVAHQSIAQQFRQTCRQYVTKTFP